MTDLHTALVALAAERHSLSTTDLDVNSICNDHIACSCGWLCQEEGWHDDDGHADHDWPNLIRALLAEHEPTPSDQALRDAVRRVGDRIGLYRVAQSAIGDLDREHIDVLAVGRILSALREGIIKAYQAAVDDAPATSSEGVEGVEGAPATPSDQALRDLRALAETCRDLCDHGAALSGDVYQITDRLEAILASSAPATASEDWEPLGEDVTMHTMAGFHQHDDGRSCMYHSRLASWTFDCTKRCLREHADAPPATTRETFEDELDDHITESMADPQYRAAHLASCDVEDCRWCRDAATASEVAMECRSTTLPPCASPSAHCAACTSDTGVTSSDGDQDDEAFYRKHYSDWTVHTLDLRVQVPLPTDRFEQDAIELVQEILDEASFDIRIVSKARKGDWKLSEEDRETICVCPLGQRIRYVAPGDAHTTECSQHRASVERILAARKDDPESSERIEWGVRQGARESRHSSEESARWYAQQEGGVVVTRTPAGPWKVSVDG